MSFFLKLLARVQLLFALHLAPCVVKELSDDSLCEIVYDVCRVLLNSLLFESAGFFGRSPLPVARYFMCLASGECVWHAFVVNRVLVVCGRHCFQACACVEYVSCSRFVDSAGCWSIHQ